MTRILKNTFGCLIIIFFAAVIILPIVGWIRNISKFVQLDFKEPYKAEIIRGVGLTPLGAIIGWINIYDN